MGANTKEISGLPTPVESAEENLLEALRLLKAGKLFEAHQATRAAMGYMSLSNNVPSKRKDVWSE